MAWYDADRKMGDDKGEEKTAREVLFAGVRARESVCTREGQGEKEQEISVCVCVCVRHRQHDAKREGQGENGKGGPLSLCQIKAQCVSERRPRRKGTGE